MRSADPKHSRDTISFAGVITVALWAIHPARDLCDIDGFNADLQSPLQYALGLKQIETGAAEARAYRLNPPAVPPPPMASWAPRRRMIRRVGLVVPIGVGWRGRQSSICYSPLDGLEFVVAWKTALAANIANHVAVEERVPVLFISLEQSDRELTERILCSHAQVDGYRVRTGRVRQAEGRRLLDAGELVTKTRLYIDDVPNQGPGRIAATARRMTRQHGVGLILIDYLQLIEAPYAKKETRQEQVGGISRRMKLLRARTKDSRDCAGAAQS